MFDELGYIHGIRTAVEQCMGVKSDEEVLVIGDSNNPQIADSFATIASSLGAETTVILMKPRNKHGEEPPKTIAGAMKGADVILIAAEYSLTHTRAREEATKKGARVASMWNRFDVLGQPMTADYEKVKEKSELIRDKLTNASKAVIETDMGTEITLDLEGRKGIADTGVFTEPGDYGNLPAGEAFIAPVEGFGDGKIVVDTAIAGIGKLSEPVIIKVRNGQIQSIEGGPEAKELEETIKSGDENSNKIAELGIGTNEQVKAMGYGITDEKIAGTVHIAFGDSSHFGGNLESETHIDGIISKPTLKLDDEIILNKGDKKF